MKELIFTSLFILASHSAFSYATTAASPPNLAPIIAAAETPTAPPEEAPVKKSEPVVVNSSKEGFQIGIKEFQEGHFAASQEAFLKALNFDQKNPFILYNLGLSALKNKQIGLAIASWRRATNVDSSYQPPKHALIYAGEKFPEFFYKRSDNFLSTLKGGVLNNNSIMVFAWIGLALALLTGVFLIKYLSLRKKAFDQNLELPDFPIKFLVASIALAIILSLSTLKWWAGQTTGAIIISKTQSVYTGPSEESTTLFELKEGQEIIVEKQLTNWTFVTYPGGFSGWVPAHSLFIHSGGSI